MSANRFPRRRFVCFGRSRVGPDDPSARTAEAVGRILGARGIDVLSGGYEGVMGAVSRGAREGGGEAIGVTTPIFTAREPNEHLTSHWVEPDYLSRLATLCRQANGFVALPGALGTLSEWMTTWCLLTIGEAEGPLFLFEDPWRPIVEAVLTLGELDPVHTSHLHWIVEAEDLARALDGGTGDGTGQAT